jgi:hypothetical protein
MKAANSTEAPENFYKFHSIIFFTVVTESNPTPVHSRKHTTFTKIKEY